MKKIVLVLMCVWAPSFIASCENVEEAVLTGGEPVPYEKLALNMFPRNRTMGDLASQFADIKSLGINHVRVNFWFDDSFLSYSGAPPNWAMFDGFVNAANAAGIEIVAILAYVPSWLQGSSGWQSVYLNQYVVPVVSRYRGSIDYWEVWNEPDELTFGVLDGSVETYFNLLRNVSLTVRSLDPSAKIIAAATVNIVADNLDKFNWTQSLIDMGLSAYADILNIHYYSDLDIELSAFGGPLVRSWGGRVWATETGKGGQANQKEYFDRNLPYINKSINPELIFWYCYVAGAGVNEENHPDTTYGLLTRYGGVRYESPLYTHLKSR